MYSEQYIQHLRTRLKIRFDRIKAASIDVLHIYLNQTVEYVEQNIILTSIVNDLLSRNKGVETIVNTFINTRSFNQSDIYNEESHATFSYLIFKKCAKSSDKDLPIIVGKRFNQNNGVDDNILALKSFEQQVVAFVINYLDEQLDRLNLIYLLLLKYKHRCEWFCRAELFKEWENNKNIGETKLKNDLFLYLYDQGVELQFIEPLSPSGRIDSLIPLAERRNLLIECKIYSSRNSIGDIKNATEQLFKYAIDYNETIGYLLIYNVGIRELRLTLSTEHANIPTLVKNNKILRVVIIDINPNRLKASKTSKSQIIEITHEDLLK
jgi:hypothetical protein